MAVSVLAHVKPLFCDFAAIPQRSSWRQQWLILTTARFVSQISS
jgi:hypothetical protein